MIKQCIKHVTLPLKGTVCYRQICVGHVLTEWLSVLIIGKNGITGMIGSTLQKIHMSLGIITYHPQVDLKLFRIYYYCYIYTYIYTYIYNHIYIIYIYYKNIYIHIYSLFFLVASSPVKSQIVRVKPAQMRLRRSQVSQSLGNDCHGDRGMELRVARWFADPML